MQEELPLQAVALVGATGTGKSALGLEIAKTYDVCLISCDSMQVYRGLDIGTSKASLVEQAQVRHALLDCTDVSHVWSAKTWADAAREHIRLENKQGKRPVIVGGTGMYLKALLHGFSMVPPEKEGVREHFEAIQHEKGTPYLHAQLAKVDIELASRLKQHDTQRVIRGLSVFESSGTPLSVWQKQHAPQQKIDCPVFVLDMEREMLRERISARFMQMMDAGWLDEVVWLKEQKLAASHPAIRAVGYRQLLQYLDGECDLDTAIRQGIIATHQFAKRQRTWFRNQTPEAFRGEKDVIQTAIQAVMVKGIEPI